MDWVLQGGLAQHREKSFIVPHVVSGAFHAERPVPDAANGLPSLRNDEFWIVHTGSLVTGRDPWALLRGFRDFLASDAEKGQRARLLMVGMVARQLRENPLWKELTAAPQITVCEQRFDYQQVLALASSAAAVALVDVNGAISPIFLAKLADYLWLRIPILAITPLVSGTRDILGSNYPLLATPTDPGGVLNAINLLWGHWKTGRLDELLPRLEAVESASETRVCGALEEACGYIRSGSRSASLTNALGGRTEVPGKGETFESFAP
jgi:hypothetical protein